MLSFTIISVIILCGAVSAAELTVGPGETYTNIQGAVNAASGGDTINVKPNGLNPYIETVTVDKNLNIAANGDVTIQKPVSASYAIAISSFGSGSTIQGFNITKTDASMDDSGISLIGADNCNILNNNITGFASGISVYISANNNLISGNTINSGHNQVGYSYGMDVSSSNNNIIKDNIINAQGTSTGSSIGIALYGTSSNQIIGNNIAVTHLDTGSEYGILFNNAGNSAHFNRIIAPIAIYDQSTGNGFDARYNWYGTNANPVSKISGQNIIYNPWLIMTISASPSTIYTGGNSNVYIDFTHDSTYDPNNPSASYHNPSLGHFPDNIGVIVNSAGGEVGSFSTTAYTRNGVATALFRATQGPGTGMAAGSLDNQDSLSVNINVLAAGNLDNQDSLSINSNLLQAPAVNAANNTIRMQETGMPIAGLILALLMVFSGLIALKK